MSNDNIASVHGDGEDNPPSPENAPTSPTSEGLPRAASGHKNVIFDHVMKGDESHEHLNREDNLELEQQSEETSASSSPRGALRTMNGNSTSNDTSASPNSTESLPTTKANGTSSTPREAPQSHILNSVKDDKDIALLTEILENTSPEVAQKVLRENWRIFLFNPLSQNEAHLSFILRAGFKNAPKVVIEKILSQTGFFRPEVVRFASKKSSVISSVLNNATDTQIIDHVPAATLDQVLAVRLKQLPAKDIIKMLAEADRLGYKHDDILDTEDEFVMPNIPSAHEDTDMTDDALPFSHHGLALPDTDPLLAEQERNAAALHNLPQAAKTAKLPKPPKQFKGTALKDVPVPNPTMPLRCSSCLQNMGNYSGYNYVSDPLVTRLN
jgi:hypothetical protein